jgi:Carboxypeptidase regulatory-like domain
MIPGHGSTSRKPRRRMSRVPRLFLALAAALLAAVPALAASAQAPASVLEITVTDAKRAPLASAMIRVGGRNVGLTDSAGALTVRGLPPGGPQPVEASLMGYRTGRLDVRLPAGAALRLEMELEVLPIELDVVSGSVHWARNAGVRGFYDRAQHADPGMVVMRGTIEHRRPARTSILLEDIPWLRAWLRSHGGSGGTRGPPTCRPAFWVDGVYDPHLGNTTGIGLLGDLDALYPPNELEGIEAYPMSQAPAQFSGPRGACGVVILWTLDIKPAPAVITRLRTAREDEPRAPAAPSVPEPNKRVVAKP